MLLCKASTWTCSILSYVKQELGHAVYVYVARYNIHFSGLDK